MDRKGGTTIENCSCPRCHLQRRWRFHDDISTRCCRMRNWCRGLRQSALQAVYWRGCGYIWRRLCLNIQELRPEPIAPESWNRLEVLGLSYRTVLFSLLRAVRRSTDPFWWDQPCICSFLLALPCFVAELVPVHE